MLDGEARSASVETLSDSELLALPAADFRRLLADHPEISVKLIGALTRRLRETNERVSRQSFQTVPSRVAGVLTQLIAEEAAPEGRQRRDDPDDPGRPRPARRHLARERQPLPGDAGARRAWSAWDAAASPWSSPGGCAPTSSDEADSERRRVRRPARATWSSGSSAGGGSTTSACWTRWRRSPASCSCRSATGGAPTRTPRCRSATGRRSPSPGSWPRSARRWRWRARSACWRSGRAPGTRRRCWPCWPREVITIERVEELAAAARQLLAELGVANVEVVVGDGSAGLPDRAPYEAIAVHATAPSPPSDPDRAARPRRSPRGPDRHRRRRHADRVPPARRGRRPRDRRRAASAR